MPFPNIDPVLAHLGPFPIRWYALAYVATILLAWRYMAGLLKNARLWTHRPPPLSTERLDDLILWLVLGVVVGGRLGSVLFYSTSLIWTDPIEILKVWHGGMSFHGGAIGVFIAGLLFARRYKVDPLRIGDIIVAAEPIGGFLVRVANFVNGELWGRTTDAPWGMVFCNQQIVKAYGHCPAGLTPRHPSQLYEAALEGIVMFIVLRWATHGRRKLLNRRGVVMGMFLAGYGIIRISLENVRQPDSNMPDFPLGLTMGMMLSTPMVIAGAWLIWRGLREPLPPALPAEAPPALAEAAPPLSNNEPA